MRLEATVETLRRDLDVEPEVAEAAELPELPEGVAAPARARDLERELRIMGPINPLALEEFNELQERHRFLEEQLEDVRKTRRELMQVITAIDTEIQSVFASAFADASNPNAALLFVNWVLSKRGQEVITDTRKIMSLRKDVPHKLSEALAKRRLGGASISLNTAHVRTVANVVFNFT